MFLRIVRPVADHLGWEDQPGEPPSYPAFRATILSLMSFCGDQTVGTIAQQAFMTGKVRCVCPCCLPRSHGSLCSPPAQYSHDLRSLVFTLAMRASDTMPEIYDRMLAIYTTSDNPEERRHALQALGRAATPALRERTLTVVFCYVFIKKT